MILNRPLPQRIPTELLWARPVILPSIDVMLRVIAAFGEAPKVHDTIAIMLIRHWMREISKTTNIDQESHPDEPRPISR